MIAFPGSPSATQGRHRGRAPRVPGFQGRCPCLREACRLVPVRLASGAGGPGGCLPEVGRFPLSICSLLCQLCGLAQQEGLAASRQSRACG